MRPALAALAVLGGIAGAPAAAPSKPAGGAAAPTREAAKLALEAARSPSALGEPQVVDVTAFRDELVVLRSEVRDAVLIMPRNGTFGDVNILVFAGTGGVVRQQRVIGGSMEAGGAASLSLWSPRSRGNGLANLQLRADGTAELTCGKGATEAYRALPADEARALVGRTRFTAPLHQRESALLARDDRGTYYFVDRRRESADEAVLGDHVRLFVGRRGVMKELPIEDVVSDSGGAIVLTRRGGLYVDDTKQGAMSWRQGGKVAPLVRLEPGENRRLIYRELGVYGQLGTPCDDL